MATILLAMLVSCGDLCRSEAGAFYGQLLAAAGYGRMPFERGAFLIREDDGTLTLAIWPHAGFARAEWRGGIPRGTIALVHTHPIGMSARPSARDVAEAKRLALPVLVVTPSGVTAAYPDGSIAAITVARNAGVPAG
jgi:hypothetical protein